MTRDQEATLCRNMEKAADALGEIKLILLHIFTCDVCQGHGLVESDEEGEEMLTCDWCDGTGYTRKGKK